MFNKLHAITPILCLLYMVGVPTLFAAENPFVRHFPIKEGLIEYVVRGTQSGSKRLYFSDYGEKQLLVENLAADIMHGRQSSHRVTLILSDEKYLIDPDTGHAVKTPRLENLLYKKFQKLTKAQQRKILENLQRNGDRALEGDGGACTSHAKRIVGLACNMEQVGGISQCSVARGALVLESSLSLLGYRVDTFATRYDKRSVDATHFTLPADLNITDHTAQAEKHADAILARLRKPLPACRPAGTHARPKPLQRMLFEEIENLSRSF